jgi:cytochrome c oxidase subunit 1
MGIVSEILPVFSRKPLFGYKAFVFATVGIGALGFSVWAHHMFTTGAVLLPFFSIMTFLIAVPTGVKMFNWIGTMWKGKLSFPTPMLFAVGFLTMFLIGGIDGVAMASPPVDFHFQDTYWVVAHIHYVLFGGSVFAVYAGLYFWWPKFTGKKLNEGLGKLHFWMHFIGFNVTFMVMHLLGLVGMPRRISDYLPSANWGSMNTLSTVGAFLIAFSTVPFLANVILTARRKDRDPEDPWEANSLEWHTTSPPPAHNFDSLPPIRSERPLFDLRHAEEVAVHSDATTTGAR